MFRASRAGQCAARVLSQVLQHVLVPPELTRIQFSDLTADLLAPPVIGFVVCLRERCCLSESYSSAFFLIFLDVLPLLRTIIIVSVLARIGVWRFQAIRVSFKLVIQSRHNGLIGFLSLIPI
jgi:general stress protein CsbA